MRSFFRDNRGGLAVTLAIALPVLAVLVAGAVELGLLYADKSRTQDVADAAALQGAKLLGLVEPNALEQQTIAFANAQLADVSDHAGIEVKVTPDSQDRSVTVSVTTHRSSFFGDLLPPGGFTTNVSATATSENLAPLCVLVHGTHGRAAAGQAPVLGQNLGGLAVGDRSSVLAPGCLIQSNQNIQVAGGAMLTAAEIQAVGVAKGPMTPAGMSGAPPIEDPFLGIDVDTPAGCPPQALPDVKITGVTELPPGLHCGGLQLSGDAVVTLAPGEHYFLGDLTLSQNAQLTGEDVVLIFDQKSKFDFSGQSIVSLAGRRSGPLAGFVVATTRQNGHAFHISASHVDQLLGTIYIPNAQLQVEGADAVGRQSEWTVIVARQLNLAGGPTLYINANYAGSSVPVPSGVGPGASQARLAH